MKIAAGKASDSFIKNPDSSILAALIFGPDTGLVSQRADILGKTIVGDLSDPFRVIDIANEKIKEDAAVLRDEISAISFGGGRRLIRINDISETMADNISSIFKEFEGSKNDSFVIITAGDLDNRSKLRKLFEFGKNLAAIACYSDDERSIRPVIQDEFRKYGLSSDSESVALLAEYCRGDRLIVIKEIEKLFLFMGSNKNVKASDVSACIGETTESTYDDICVATAEGNKIALEKHLTKAINQGEMVIVILRLVHRYFTRIQLALSMISNGMPREEAIRTLNIFWKSIPMFSRLIDRWGKSEAKIWKVLDLLYNAELECKKTGSNPELICSHYLFKAAEIAGGR